MTSLRPAWRALLVAAGCVGSIASAAAQTPASGEILVNSSDTSEAQHLLDLDCQPATGDCAIFWQSLHRIGPFPSLDYHDYLVASRLATRPQPTVREHALLRTDDNIQSLAATAKGTTWAVFWTNFPFRQPEPLNQALFQRFDRRFRPLDSPLVHDFPGAEPSGLSTAATTTTKGFALLTFARDQGAPDFSNGAFLSVFNSAGGLENVPATIHETTHGTQAVVPGSLCRGGAPPFLAAVYLSDEGTKGVANSDVYLRRFAQSGEPLGPSLRVNTFRKGSQTNPAVACSAAGRLAVVWDSKDQDGSDYGVYAQRFDARGRPAGPEFPVHQTTFSTQASARVAMDPHGNFLVTWMSFDPAPLPGNLWDIKARLFRANGTPVGPEINVNVYRILEQTGPTVASAGHGLFLVAWESNSQLDLPGDSDHDVFTRLLAASPGDEPCLVSPGRLRCDTGRSGGAPEILHTFGPPEEPPHLLGDLDGDGRDDPCFWNPSARRLHCDIDHEGGTAEARWTLRGEPLDADPRLADTDGDGRDDPCLVSFPDGKGPARIACDTRRHGLVGAGVADSVLRFGQPGETILLGDLDGDGDDEPCAYALVEIRNDDDPDAHGSAGRWRCDLRHDGEGPELLLHLVQMDQPGDLPLLGDYDGDGDDDPCFARAARLLCDTDHDGTIDATLDLDPGDGLTHSPIVRLANLDGL